MASQGKVVLAVNKLWFPFSGLDKNEQTKLFCIKNGGYGILQDFFTEKIRRVVYN